MLRINKDVNFDPTSNGLKFYKSTYGDYKMYYNINTDLANCDFNNTDLDNVIFLIKND